MDRIDILATKLPTRARRRRAQGAADDVPPKAGHESDVEQFLRGGREIVEEEDGTLAWFALKFEDGRYGIFDVFPDTKSRLAHLAGRVPREVAKHAASLLGSVPDMDKCDVLAAKLAD